MKLAAPLTAILAVGALVFALGAAADAAVVIWVTENTDGGQPPSPDDVGWTNLLTAEGYTVDRRPGRPWRDLSASEIDDLNAADLVIVSRDTDSGQYDDGNEPTVWNGITTPLMLMSQYLTRRTRWKWVNTTDTPNNGDGDLQIVDAGHPMFQGVTLGPGDTLDFASSRTPATGTTVGNGHLIATDDDNANITIAEWDAGTEFYGGSGQVPGGKRMFFGAGYNENNPKGAYNLTAAGEQVFLNAVDYLAPSGPPAPEESDWEYNKSTREDARPLEVYRMPGQPTIDGELAQSEWTGATTYETLDAQTGASQGMLYAGISDGYLVVANDWTINDDPDPAIGGRNAWRFGTSTDAGPGNSGNGDWYEVLVVDDGPVDQVWARVASTESELQNAAWRLGTDFGIEGGAAFNGQNWQYELFLGEVNPGPGELPFCYHWEWQQLDPRPGDGVWIPVFDGSVHHAPEPATLLIWALLAGLGLTLGLRRRKR